MELALTERFGRDVGLKIAELVEQLYRQETRRRLQLCMNELRVLNGYTFDMGQQWYQVPKTLGMLDRCKANKAYFAKLAGDYERHRVADEYCRHWRLGYYTNRTAPERAAPIPAPALAP